MPEASLKVQLLSYPAIDAERLVAMAAKLCYSPSSVEDLRKATSKADQRGFVDKLVHMGHHSPLEHAVFSFGVEGISRACSHQLVRHRVASYSQQSQRYVKETDFDYIIPPSIRAREDAKTHYENYMTRIQAVYSELVKGLEAMGYKGEAAYQDARYMLPNATETKIIITMNARELRHFFKVRCCNRAQWEIQALADAMLVEVRKIAPILFINAGPACVTGHCPEGKMTCGRMTESMKDFYRG